MKVSNCCFAKTYQMGGISDYFYCEECQESCRPAIQTGFWESSPWYPTEKCSQSVNEGEK